MVLVMLNNYVIFDFELFIKNSYEIIRQSNKKYALKMLVMSQQLAKSILPYTHKSKKYHDPQSRSQIKNAAQKIKLNKNKNTPIQPMIHKNDVPFNQKVFQCNSLSYKTVLQTIIPLLKDIYPPSKQLLFKSLDSYGQFSQEYQEIIKEDKYIFDDYFLPSEQRDYCYKKTLQLAHIYGLQKINFLTQDIQVCKPHIIFHTEIHMIWDLIKQIALDIASTIYLHLLCIIVEEQSSLKRQCSGLNKDKMQDYKHFKENIENFKMNAYPTGKSQELQNLQQDLREYVKNWTNIFENEQNSITKCMRKTPKRPRKNTQPIAQ